MTGSDAGDERCSCRRVLFATWSDPQQVWSANVSTLVHARHPSIRHFPEFLRSLAPLGDALKTHHGRFLSFHYSYSYSAGRLACSPAQCPCWQLGCNDAS